MGRAEAGLRVSTIRMRRRRAVGLALAGLFIATAAAEVCTTQAKMAPAERDALADAALGLGKAVQANDTVKVRAATVSEYAADFSASEYLIRATSARVAGETLRVTSVYGLDATARKADATGDAEFTCPLSETTQETDFTVPGLPPGNYGFAMVEASGERPWLLSFLLRKDGAGWKMAGFYPHARTAAGHDGLWYWTTAREQAKAKHPWAAWLLYGEADTLLRPANFVLSTHLDKLRAEQRTAAPPELSNGVSADTPLVVASPKAGEFHFIGVSSEGSEDGKRVNVMLHLRGDSVADPVAARARNAAAAGAFVNAHPELRQVFQGVWVFAEAPNNPPFATEHAMSEIP